MQKIHVLDQNTINKIAAGEVIERPASIVKELIENSIDAKAKCIKIEIEEAGKKNIKITDDGLGISKEDLLFAPIRHATSKIKNFDDIYNTFTMGFRGEALSSICHVATLKIISKVQGEEAYEIVADPEVSGPKLTNHNLGTTIMVQGLFANVPVRKKYLRSNATEFSYIYDVVQKFALIYPEMDFVLISDGKEIINSTGINNLENLGILFFGKDLKNKLIPIETEVGNIKFKGIISKPDYTFTNKNQQIIAVNNRIIKNFLLQKAIQDAYLDMVPQRRFPLAILNIEIDTQSIDINIHPQKTDIKFFNLSFLLANLTKIVKLNLNLKKEAGFDIKIAEKKYTNDFQILPKNVAPRFYGLLFNPDLEGEKQGVFAENSQLLTNDFEFFQLFNTFIFIKAQDGAYIIDQHAAHERLLYERIKEEKNSITERQVLLVPEVIELGEKYSKVFKENTDVFESLKFSVEDFGNNQMVVREIPLTFKDILVKDFVLTFLDNLLLEERITEPDLEKRKEKYQSLACKAAIKAGKKLDIKEVKNLVRELLAEKVPMTCPHGRPFFVKLDKNDLEKLFLRK
jgi:DNA mismatch repair protein MutL